MGGGAVAKSATIKTVATLPSSSQSTVPQVIPSSVPGVSNLVIDRINAIQKQIDDKKAADLKAQQDAQEAAQEQDNIQTNNTNTVITEQPVYTPPAGSCSDWLISAGIAETTVVDELIASESGCSVTAQNASGACGIGQLIGGCDSYDPVQQLIEMNSYVMSRYGSYEAAWAHKCTTTPTGSCKDGWY